MLYSRLVFWEECMLDFSKAMKKYTGKTLHDAGLLILFCAFLGGCIVMAKCNATMYKENLMMLAITFVVAVLAGYKIVNGAFVLAAVQTIIFIGYKIYVTASKGNEDPISFAWIFVPGLIVLGFSLIISAKTELERYNEVMQEQIGQLVMVDELTGLYNLRSMYMDIQTQISYAERNNKQICLMLIKPRYYSELARVLKKKQLEEVIIRLSKIICDTVRLEDKVYAVDSEGEFGVILTCDKAGSELVEERLREKFMDQSAYDGIVEGNKLRVEMQIGCLEHNESFERDAIMFKACVEEEMEKDF